jgi:hypothetical protein
MVFRPALSLLVTDTAQPFLEKKESAVGLKSALTFLKKA